MYNTLAHRAKVVSSNTTELARELDHLRRALQGCVFPIWALNKLQHQFEHKHINNRKANSTEEQHSRNHNSSVTTIHNKHRNISMVVSYHTLVGERSSRGLAINRVNKFISREQTPSRNFSWHQKTRMVNFKKEGLFTHTNAHISTVQKNT